MYSRGGGYAGSAEKDSDEYSNLLDTDNERCLFKNQYAAVYTFFSLSDSRSLYIKFMLFHIIFMCDEKSKYVLLVAPHLTGTK